MMPDDCRVVRMGVAGLLLGAALAVVVAGDVAALPLVRSLPPSQAILVADPSAPTGAEAGAPFTELNDALAAARSRLEELSRAAEAVAATGGLRHELAALKEQNRQLSDEVEALRAERAAQQGKDARIAELTRSAAEATAKAQKLDEELVALRWQNAQLNTSVAQARTAREKVEAEAAKAGEAVAAKLEQLNAALEQSTTELARMRHQLTASEQKLAIAVGARTEAQAQWAEMQEQLHRAEDASQRFDQQAATLKEQVSKAEQERDRALEHAATLRAETGEVRTRLAALEAELEGVRLTNDQLEMEVTAVRAAASSATDAARRNLAAVEDRIRQLNDALAVVEPAAGPADTAAPAQAAAPAGTQGTWVAAINPPVPSTAPVVTAPIPPPAAPTARAPAPVAPAAVTAPIPRPVTPAAVTAPIGGALAPSEGRAQDGAAADIGLIKSANAADSQAAGAVGVAYTDLPLEQRLHVQGLLADLDTKVDQRGLTLTVPGGELFATNSDEVQASAHDALAKVAELLSVYDDRRVLIVGHTDAIGDASYNKHLSERRADLVKQFFVDKFEIAPARLATEGLGEDRPIASNDTPDGRRTNRRVEVVILN